MDGEATQTHILFWEVIIKQHGTSFYKKPSKVTFLTGWIYIKVTKAANQDADSPGQNGKRNLNCFYKNVCPTMQIKQRGQDN